ncbi:hypothetical protein BURPS1710A_3424 [Burkholderia pseudomallei 1710a]|uniref:Uncharacterized protein n=1 Tax=Burkholderia pseudomallei 1710a TaxID=320371 RepID=A0A0E1W7N2_BURPE|nr:hypothetical protein BURPS1710A_3424 [Burkholderia pseudomallei 1710a]
MRSIIDAVRGEPRGLRPLIAFGYEKGGNRLLREMWRMR